MYRDTLMRHTKKKTRGYTLKSRNRRPKNSTTKGGSGQPFVFGQPSSGQDTSFNKNRTLRGKEPSIFTSPSPKMNFNLAEAYKHFKISTPEQEQFEKKLKLINQFIHDMRHRFANLQAEYEMIVNSIVSRTKALDKNDSSINISEDVIIKIQMNKLDVKTREWNDLNAEWDAFMKKNDPYDIDKYTMRDHFSSIKRKLDERISPLSERKRKRNINNVNVQGPGKYQTIELPVPVKSLTPLEKIQHSDDANFETYVKEFIGSITTNGTLNPGKTVSMVELIVAILKRINARTGQNKDIPEQNYVEDLNDKKRAEIKGYLEDYNKGAKTDETTFEVLSQILLAILDDTQQTIALEGIANSSESNG